MVSSDELITSYHIRALDFERLPDTNNIELITFIGFLTSLHAQKFISEYDVEKYSGQTWFPMAVKNT